MRTSACTFALLMFLPAAALAREGRDDGGPRRARWGGLGFMQLGTHIGPVADVAGTLRAPDALGERATGPGFGYSVGGGGRAVALRRLVLGGRGFGTFAPRVGGERGSASFTGGGGGLELGVAAVNRDHWLLIPYVGGGGGGITMQVSNDSDGELFVADDEAIPSGGQRTYDAGFAYLEFGVGAHRLLFFGGGGLALGVDVGGMFTVASTPWSAGGRELEGVGRGRFSGGFLRLTIGGGGFSFD